MSKAPSVAFSHFGFWRKNWSRCTLYCRVLGSSKPPRHVRAADRVPVAHPRSTTRRLVEGRTGSIDELVINQIAAGGIAGRSLRSTR
jgi:hypothetical protein